MKKLFCLLMALTLLVVIPGCRKSSDPSLEKISFTEVEIAVTSQEQIAEALKSTKILYQYTYDSFYVTVDVEKGFDRAALSSVPYTSTQNTENPYRISIAVRYDDLQPDFLVKLAGNEKVKQIYIGVPNGNVPEA